MRILLIGNYPNDGSQSMLRFGSMMERELSHAGYSVDYMQPSVFFGRLWPGSRGVGKWLGYLDKFVVSPSRIRRAARKVDLVHVCDHSNAMYLRLAEGRPTVITCHDFFAVRSGLGLLEEKQTRWSGRVLQRWILRSIRDADAIACVSETRRADVAATAGLEDRLYIAPLTLQYDYTRMEAGKAEEHLRALDLRPGQRFIFHVGGNQWYKNRPGVLRIFAEVLRQPATAHLHLVMAGKPFTREMRRVVRQLGLKDRVTERVSLPNEALRALYSTAEALLFPSLAEGFGWPMLEANTAGCPLITSMRMPMLDVARGSAIFIDPEDPVAAATEIARRWGERAEFCANGTENAKRFSREVMIAAYRDIYDALLARRAQARKDAVEPSRLRV